MLIWILVWDAGSICLAMCPQFILNFFLWIFTWLWRQALFLSWEMGGARTEGSRAGSRTDGPFGQRWSCVSPRCNPAPPAPASRARCLGELSLGSEPSKRSPVVTPQTNCKPALPPLCRVPRWRSPLRIMPVSMPRDLGGRGGYWRSRINVTPPRPHGGLWKSHRLCEYPSITLWNEDNIKEQFLGYIREAAKPRTGNG